MLAIWLGYPLVVVVCKILYLLQQQWLQSVEEKNAERNKLVADESVRIRGTVNGPNTGIHTAALGN